MCLQMFLLRKQGELKFVPFFIRNVVQYLRVGHQRTLLSTHQLATWDKDAGGLVPCVSRGRGVRSKPPSVKLGLIAGHSKVLYKQASSLKERGKTKGRKISLVAFTLRAKYNLECCSLNRLNLC